MHIPDYVVVDLNILRHHKQEKKHRVRVVENPDDGVKVELGFINGYAVYAYAGVPSELEVAQYAFSRGAGDWAWLHLERWEAKR